MNKKYAFAAIATIAVGVAVGAAQFITAKPAAAQASGPLTAECRTKDAAGKPVFWIGNGDTVLFVPRGSPLMADRGGPRTSYEPGFRNKVASVELKPGCRAVLYGKRMKKIFCSVNRLPPGFVIIDRESNDAVRPDCRGGFVI